MPVIYSSTDEDEGFQTSTRRKVRTEQFQATTDAELARRMVAIAQRYPDLPPEAAIGAARAGISPTDSRLKNYTEYFNTYKTKQNQTFLLPQLEAGYNYQMTDQGPEKYQLPVVIGSESSNPNALQQTDIKWLPKDDSNIFMKGAKKLGQGLTMTLSAPLEAAESLVRDVANSPTDFAKGLFTGETYGDVFVRGTTYGQYMSGRLEGRTSTELVGNGFFASENGIARQRQAQFARNQYSVNGRAWTLGRQVADLAPDSLVEPGGGAYNFLSGSVDFGKSLFLDPANKLGKVGKASGMGAKAGEKSLTVGQSLLAADELNALQKVIDNPASIGLIEKGLQTGSSRSTAYIPLAQSFFTSNKAGIRLVNKMADMTSPGEIYFAFNKKIGLDTATELANAPDAKSVLNVIGNHFNDSFQAEDVWKAGTDTIRPLLGQGTQFKRSLTNRRIFQDAPNAGFRLDDTDQLTESIVRHGYNAGLKQEQLVPILDELVKTPEQGRRNFIYNFLDTIESRIDSDTLKKIAKKHDVEATELRSRLDKVAEQVSQGKKLSKVEQSLFLKDKAAYEEIQSYQQVARDFSQATLKREKDLNTAASLYDVSDAGINKTTTMQLDGKSVDLGDGAYKLHSEFSEYIPSPDYRSIRRATGVLQNIQKYPMLYKSITGTERVMDLMTSVFKPLKLARAAWPLRVIAEEQIRMGFNDLDSAFHHPLSYITWLVGDEGSVANRAAKKLGVDVEKWGRGLEDIDGNTFNRFTSEIEDGQRSFLEALSIPNEASTTKFHAARFFVPIDKTHAKAHEGWSTGLRLLHADPMTRHLAENGIEASREFLTTPQGRALLSKEIINKGWDKATGKSVQQLLDTPEILDTALNVRLERLLYETGNNDELIKWVGTGKFRDEVVAPEQFNKTLRTYFTDGDMLPDWAPNKLKIAQGLGEKTNTYDQVVSLLFNNLMSKETNFLSRSPAFRQAYAQRIKTMFPNLDSDAQSKVLAWAEKTMDTPLDKSFSKSLRAAKGSGELTHEAADLTAKAFGVKATQDLLYDISDKSQFFDIFRNIFPFGEAWKEVLSVWTKQIGRGDLRPLHRLDQGLRAGHQTGFISYDEYGNETFTYPFSQQITQAISGLPLPITGSVQGLSLFSDTFYMPGMGPAASWTMDKIIPNKPSFDNLREMLFPYGPPDESFLGKWAGPLNETLEPAKWVKDVVTYLEDDPQSNRDYSNLLGQAADYLRSTGDYGNSREEQLRLEHDAIEQARDLLLVKTMADFMSPSSPKIQTMVNTNPDKDGDMRLQKALTLADEYRELAKQEGSQMAARTMMATYGDNILSVIAPKTEGTFQATEQLHNFVRTHPDVVKKYPEFYGYLSPGGDFVFSLEEQQRQLKTGERKYKAWDVRQKEINAHIAMVKYRTIRDSLPARLNPEQSAALKEYRAELAKQYYGFDLDATMQIPQYSKRIDTLTEVLVADEPTRDLNPSLTKYIKVRDTINQQLIAQGSSMASRASALAGIKSGLYEYGTELSIKDPSFRYVWEDLLSKEVDDFVGEENG